MGGERGEGRGNREEGTGRTGQEGGIKIEISVKSVNL
jgi:hypothetical protein